MDNIVNIVVISDNKRKLVSVVHKNLVYRMLDRKLKYMDPERFGCHFSSFATLERVARAKGAIPVYKGDKIIISLE